LKKVFEHEIDNTNSIIVVKMALDEEDWATGISYNGL
jgi:hypothetical protein